MKNIYIAINGDDVGARIGAAITNDDHEALSQASSSIQNAHDSVDQWIESIGGKKISSAGDDAIYLAPEQAVNDLDSVREQYKQESGHGLTVGVGASMSQAAKALIYGKLNGKNQTIHYEPAIEDYLSDDEDDQMPSSPEVPEEGDLQDQADTDMEADAGTGELADAPPQEDVDDSDSAVPGAEAVAEDPQGSEEDPAMDDAPPAGDEDDLSEDDQTQADAPAAPAANKTPAQAEAGNKPAGNVPEIDGKDEIDSGAGPDDLAADADIPGADESATDEDLPDTDEEASAQASEGDEGAPVADDGMDADMDEMPEEDGTEHPELSDEDVAASDEDVAASDDGIDDTADDGEDPLASMIHGDMQEGDDGSGDVGAEDDSSLDDELRQDIAEALMSFKENKHYLEAARDSNPELYNATLTMLRSMIAMAKKLGFGPEQDMADKEAEQQLDQEFPAADEGGEMPPEDEPADEMADESEEEQEMPSEKTPAKGAAPTEKK